LVLMDKFLSLYYSQHEAKLCNKIVAIVSGMIFLVVLIIWVIRPVIISTYPVWIYSLFIFIPAFILCFFFIVKFNPEFKNISQEEMKSFSSFSFVVLLTNIIQFVAFRADYWFLNFYYDNTAVGVYAQASKFAQLLWIIPGVLAGLIIPALKNENEKLTESAFVSVCRILFYTHFFLSLLVISVSLVIYTFFLPAIYFNGFLALLIMLPGYLLFTITTMLAAYFSANRLLKVNLIGSSLCCVFMLLLDLLLIPSLSYQGAAIANLVAYSITSVYFIYRSISFIKISFKDLLVIKRSDFNLFSARILKTDKSNT
ncbi:MAG TPA: polysaccharide biosynthesis C-terminal domain-containing protein, partial [Chitinophagaceae bacterium]|nr:polysaccharide biosynthesis C-terminal domain-containing protein [Chitinophagaceae bacterium]